MNFKLIILLFALTSCDAVNQLSYYVKNNTDNEIEIMVPNYSTDRRIAFQSSLTDTTLIIPAGEKIWVGNSRTDIDFPWATKKIYKEHPGKCGIQFKNDTLPCDKNNWKYRRKTSIFVVK